MKKHRKLPIYTHISNSQTGVIKHQNDIYIYIYVTNIKYFTNKTITVTTHPYVGGTLSQLTNKSDNNTPLATATDKSNPSKRLYYISGNNFPFAIHIPVSFIYPAEKQIITDVFPNFAPWAASNGSQYTTWYKNRR